MTDIIPISNVRSIVKDDKMATLLDPAQCLALLRNYAGCLEAFVKFFGVSEIVEQQWILFQAVTTMKTDKELNREWKDTIKLNRDVRFDLLREKALQRLEGRHTGFEETMDERKGTVTYRYKELDDLAFAKVVLGDELAGRIVDAKSRPAGPKQPPTTDDLDEDDDDDEEALKRAAGGA